MRREAGDEEVLSKPTDCFETSLQPTLAGICYPTNSLNFLNNKITPNGQSQAEGKSSCRHTPPHTPLKLRIIVVGAGLAGLASAVALALHGHNVTVLEQVEALAEVGAGIQVPPNSTRHLHDWGLGPRLDVVATLPSAMTLRRWKNGKAIAHTDLGSVFRSKYHAPYYVIHRADFHEILHARAVELGVVVQLGSKVQHWDDQCPSVITEDGKIFQADLIVAADGIHSKARKIVDETAEDARPTEFVAYRAMAPTKLMRDDPDTAWLLEEPDLNLWIGHDKHVMSYTISGGNTFNMVLAHKDSSDPSTWTAASAREDMERQFAGWDPSLMKVISKVEKLQKWPLMQGGPQGRWVSPSGRMVILGDAAHAMLPFMSQGAAMAVEDAAALAASLGHLQKIEDLGRILGVFEQIRKTRTSQMQQASEINAKLLHFADGPEQQARDAAMEAEVLGIDFEESANQWSDPKTQEWAYGFDAVETINKVLA